MHSDLDAKAPQTVTATAVSTTSTAAVRIHPTAGTVGHQKIVLQADVDTYVRFGDSTVGAAGAGDELLVADVAYPFEIGSDSTHFRALGSGSGTLYHFVEGYAP